MTHRRSSFLSDAAPTKPPTARPVSRPASGFPCSCSTLHGPSEPFLVQIDAALCTKHRDDATVKDFATEYIYNLAEKACANANLPWPERTRTRLKFLPYAESQLGKMKNRELAQKN